MVNETKKTIKDYATKNPSDMALILLPTEPGDDCITVIAFKPEELDKIKQDAENSDFIKKYSVTTIKRAASKTYYENDSFFETLQEFIDICKEDKALKEENECDSVNL